MKDMLRRASDVVPALRDRLSSAGEAALDLLYPSALYCNCCGNLIDQSRTYHLCDHCIAHIRWDGAGPKNLDGMKILRCTQYGLYERNLIFDLKYNGKTYIARDIAEIMDDRLALAEEDFDVIVPVPMWRGKERERGFNQAALIGKYLGKRTGKPCWDHCLVRTAPTKAMRGLSPTEREENVKGKFALSEKYGTMLEGKRVLLIDDFYTTGSTARACYQALQEGAPQSVTFLSFAAK